MATEAVPANASVAFTGLGIQYIGSGQYQAASGTVDVDNNETNSFGICFAVC